MLETYYFELSSTSPFKTTNILYLTNLTTPVIPETSGLLSLHMIHIIHMCERERFNFRQYGLGVGIWRPPRKWHVAPSTERLSYGLGGLSIYCTRTPGNVHGLIYFVPAYS